jgi:hypothetical protein
LLVRNIPNTNYKDATSVYGYVGPLFNGNISNFDNSELKNMLTGYFKEHNFVSIFSRLNPYIPNQDNILSNIGIISKQGKVVNINLTENIEIQRQHFQSRLKTYIKKDRRNCSIEMGSTAMYIQILRIYIMKT